MADSIINEHDPNLALYSRKSIADHYAQLEKLFPAESAIFDRVRTHCYGLPILDLGVGAGRTTPHLLQLSADYLGIDYSAQMVAQCRRRFPGVHFEQADARRLDAYPAGHFAFILFSFNGLDYVPHTDRLVILRQVWRLLAKGGLFAFSTHNRRVRHISPFDVGRFLTINPLKIINRVGHYVCGIARYHRLRRYVREELDYAIRVDGAFNYSIVTYYINIVNQVRQLQTVGFDTLALFNAEGNEILANSNDASPWVYYLTRKAG